MVKINKEALRKFSKAGGALAKAVSPDSIYADFTGLGDDDDKKKGKKKTNGNGDSKSNASNGAKDMNSFDEYDTEKGGVNG